WKPPAAALPRLGPGAGRPARRRGGPHRAGGRSPPSRRGRNAMRAVWTLCTLALCAASTGCLGFLYTTDVYGGWGVFANVCRNLTEAPVYGADQVVITCRNCQLATQAWAEYRKNCPPGPPPDFACGFK